MLLLPYEFLFQIPMFYGKMCHVHTLCGMIIQHGYRNLMCHSNEFINHWLQNSIQIIQPQIQKRYTETSRTEYRPFPGFILLIQENTL